MSNAIRCDLCGKIIQSTEIMKGLEVRESNKFLFRPIEWKRLDFHSKCWEALQEKMNGEVEE